MVLLLLCLVIGSTYADVRSTISDYSKKLNTTNSPNVMFKIYKDFEKDKKDWFSIENPQKAKLPEPINSGCEIHTAMYFLDYQIRDALYKTSSVIYKKLITSTNHEIMFFQVSEHNYKTIERYADLINTHGAIFGNTLMHVDSHPDDSCWDKDKPILEVIKSLKPSDRSFNLSVIKNSFTNINELQAGACLTGISEKIVWIRSNDSEFKGYKRVGWRETYHKSDAGELLKVEPTTQTGDYLNPTPNIVSSNFVNSCLMESVDIDNLSQKQNLPKLLSNKFILDIDLDFFIKSGQYGCESKWDLDHRTLIKERITSLISILKTLKDKNNMSPSIINFVESSQQLCSGQTCECPISEPRYASDFTPPCVVETIANQLYSELIKLYDVKKENIILKTI